MSDPCREAFEKWLYNPSTNQDELDFGKSYSGNQLELAPAFAQAWFAAYTAIRTTLPTREELVEMCYTAIKAYAFRAMQDARGSIDDEAEAVADAILARLKGATHE